MVALNYPLAAALSTVLALLVLLTVVSAGVLTMRSTGRRG
jgi:ABC-type spermidine/putrescine transport system permease subunit I